MASKVQAQSPIHAFRIIGSAACNTHDLRRVNDAWSHLDGLGRQYLTYVCRRNGIESGGGHFQLTSER